MKEIDYIKEILAGFDFNAEYTKEQYKLALEEINKLINKK